MFEEIQIQSHQNPFRFEHTPFTPLKAPTNFCRIQQSTKEKSSLRSFKKFKKTVWTKEEDELLKSKVVEHRPLQWGKIAQFLPNRSGKQCRQRWHNHLREGVSKKAWNVHQYWMLALCVRAFGRKWSAISQFMPGRSDNTIKNQWNCKMKPFKDKFDHNIDMLLTHTELWESMNAQQKILLQIIANNKSQGKVVSEQEKFANMISEYCNMIDECLSEFQEVRTNLEMERSSCQADGKEEQDDGPGDLSVAISGGEYIFYESEEENPIRPIRYEVGQEHH